MILAFADGGARPNPGDAAYGFVIYDTNKQLPTYESTVKNLPNELLYKKFVESLPKEDIVFTRGEVISIEGTNNDAEWRGALEALKYVYYRYNNTQEVVLLMDSSLVVGSINEDWVTTSNNHAIMRYNINLLKNKFPKFTCNWIRREQNSYADAMANKALDLQAENRDSTKDYLMQLPKNKRCLNFIDSDCLI